MFHLFIGKKTDYDSCVILQNELFGIEVIYTGLQNEGSFFLAPLFDANNQTWRYYAFDTLAQKNRFERILKIQGVGGKTGYHIAMLPQDDLKAAVENMDSAYFQQLPGVGPKTAKRLLLELKQTVTQEDIAKLSGDDKIAKDITTSLQSLGYSAQAIKALLPSVPHRFEKESVPVIMKWLIDHL